MPNRPAITAGERAMNPPYPTPMTIALGCIADDYTGASDLANTLSKAGLRTVQTIGVPDDLVEAGV